ncbi:MAG: hypothetical protein ABI867_10450 [Kofleriaceae bacterium]
MQLRTSLFILTLLVPSIAAAQEPDPEPAPTAPVPTPPPPAPAPVPVAMPIVDPSGFAGPADRSIQLQARLATQIGTTSVLSPGFAVGYRMGDVVIGGQLGVMRATLDAGGSSSSASIVQLVPMVYWDFWKSKDGRARMNLVGGIGIGKASLSLDDGDDKIDATFIPVLAGVGGGYYLHKNFSIGVEIGTQVPLLTSVEADGDDQEISASVQSIHGLIRFTFITGD